MCLLYDGATQEHEGQRCSGMPSVGSTANTARDAGHLGRTCQSVLPLAGGLLGVVSPCLHTAAHAAPATLSIAWSEGRDVEQGLCALPDSICACATVHAGHGLCCVEHVVSTDSHGPR